MTERPILMSAPMVLGCLREVDPKTQTRRIVKSPHELGAFLGFLPERRAWFSTPNRQFASTEVRCPYGVPGDFLWVREAHYLTDDGDSEYAIYAADEPSVSKHLAECLDMSTRHPVGDGWLKRHTRLRPSIHMPRWASRISLRITDVRVERLNEISEADALAEGIEYRAVDSGYPGAPPQDAYFFGGGHDEGYTSALGAYRALWEHINGPGSWAANPWVWCVAFEVVR